MIADVNPVNNDRTFCYIIKPQKQASNSRFTGATVTDNSDALVRLDSQVEFAENISAATWISEENISKFNASVQVHDVAWLFGVNRRWLFNNTKYCACSLLGFWNTGHLADTHAAADSTNKNDVTACKHTLRVKVESLYEHGGNVKDESYEDESDWLGVAKEETADVSSLDVG